MLEPEKIWEPPERRSNHLAVQQRREEPPDVNLSGLAELLQPRRFLSIGIRTSALAALVTPRMEIAMALVPDDSGYVPSLHVIEAGPTDGRALHAVASAAPFDTAFLAGADYGSSLRLAWNNLAAGGVLACFQLERPEVQEAVRAFVAAEPLVYGLCLAPERLRQGLYLLQKPGLPYL